MLHCYSGSYEDAVRYVDMGYYIAFGGALTFKNATKQRCIAEKLPLERIVIETDCPYMTPEPHRGKRNSPLLIHSRWRCSQKYATRLKKRRQPPIKTRWISSESRCKTQRIKKGRS
ncbi:MAG: TatD family hydrolase [Eubacteriales bacterium]